MVADDFPTEILQLGTPWDASSGTTVMALPWSADRRQVWSHIRLSGWSPEASDPRLAQAIERSVRPASAPVETSLELPSQVESQSRYLQAELDRLRASPDRSVLLALATELQALRTQDWVLAASESELASFIETIGKGAGRLALADQPQRLALRFEATALRLSAEAVMDPSLAESEKHLGYLIRQTGQLAHYPDVLIELVDLAQTVTEIETRIASENHIFLEDSSRAARLRAFEWLQARGSAPLGYDPLSRSSRRQQALDRWRAEMDRAEQAQNKAGGSASGTRPSLLPGS